MLKKIAITIYSGDQFDDNRELYTELVWAWCVDGWGIHKDFECPIYWAITHINTGLAAHVLLEKEAVQRTFAKLIQRCSVIPEFGNLTACEALELAPILSREMGGSDADIEKWRRDTQGPNQIFQRCRKSPAA